MKELTIDDVKEERLTVRPGDAEGMCRHARATAALNVANVVNELQSSYGPYLLGDAALHKLNFLKGKRPRKNPRYVAPCESPKSSKLSGKSNGRKATLKSSTKKDSKSSSRSLNLDKKKPRRW